MKKYLLLIALFGVSPAAAHAASELPTPYPYPEPAWSPFVVGALIGLLAVSTPAMAGKKIGASSAYSDSAGLIGRVVAPRHLASIPYFQNKNPMIGWTFTIVLGAMLGSYVFALTSKYSSGTVNRWGERGKVTLPQLVGLSPGVFIVIAVPVLVAVLLILELVIGA